MYIYVITVLVNELVRTKIRQLQFSKLQEIKKTVLKMLSSKYN